MRQLKTSGGMTHGRGITELEPRSGDAVALAPRARV